MYKKIKTEERKPEVEKSVIAIWDLHGFDSALAAMGENGYWHLCHGDWDECDEPDYWLEEIN